MYTRTEVADKSDLALQLAFHRTAVKIQADWRRGAPGRLSDVCDLALIRLEADLRCLSLSPLPAAGQLRLDVV